MNDTALPVWNQKPAVDWNETLPEWTHSAPTEWKDLWDLARDEIQSNVVRDEKGHQYFGAGKHFGPMVYTRDISLSGLLGLNMYYPALMDASIRHTRDLRLNMGLCCVADEKPSGDHIPWIVHDCTNREFTERYHTNGYNRRTDDVVWLWAMADLYARHPQIADWPWLLATGERCFSELYDYFYDAEDGLYRGQSCFVDIGSAYPDSVHHHDCCLVKATSTNALYVKGMAVLAEAAAHCGDQDRANQWQERRADLRCAMHEHLRHADGTFGYLKTDSEGLETRRHNLADAFVVLCDIVKADDMPAVMSDYPVLDEGIPLLAPFYDRDTFYHNNSIWPFADAFGGGPKKLLTEPVPLMNNYTVCVIW